MYKSLQNCKLEFRRGQGQSVRFLIQVCRDGKGFPAILRYQAAHRRQTQTQIVATVARRMLETNLALSAELATAFANTFDPPCRNWK